MDYDFFSFLVEQPFGRLKGRFLSITPLFVQRDDHVVGLIRLLTLAVHLSEYTARRALAEEKGKLTGVYAGNPKRGTKRSTTERMLRAFNYITLTVININGQTIRQEFTQRTSGTVVFYPHSFQDFTRE